MFSGDIRKKIVHWLFKGCNQYEIHELHVHKAILYMRNYLQFRLHKIDKISDKTFLYKKIAAVCLGLSIKLYEKASVRFEHLHQIFQFNTSIKELYDLEYDVVAANNFKLIVKTFYEHTNVLCYKILSNYALHFDIFDNKSFINIENELMTFSKQLREIFNDIDSNIVDELPHNFIIYKTKKKH
jgi:cystathionine beta-lyase/cystathionine gamma-synthase